MHQQPTPTPATHGSGGGNGKGTGKQTEHRLAELERRNGVLEGKVDDLALTCKGIETKLNDMPNKSFVLTACGLTGGGLLITLVGHLIIRSFGAG